MTEPLHLSEFFRTGRLFELKIPNPRDPDSEITFELWLQKPNPLQQNDAIKKGRAKQARAKQIYRDETTDEYMSLSEEVLDVGGVEELIEALTRMSLPNKRQQAYQEVLYSDDVGSKWGAEGGDYIDLLEAIRDRRDEILKHNESLSEEDQHLVLSPEEDEELRRLFVEEEKFEAEVRERTDYLMEQEKAQLRLKTIEDLRKQLFDKMVEIESGMAWMEEYRANMLFASCRQPENHNRFYFKSVDDIWELPDFVRSRLFDAFSDIDEDIDDIKNSLSPLLS